MTFTASGRRVALLALCLAHVPAHAGLFDAFTTDRYWQFRWFTAGDRPDDSPAMASAIAQCQAEALAAAANHRMPGTAPTIYSSSNPDRAEDFNQKMRDLRDIGMRDYDRLAAAARSEAAACLAQALGQPAQLRLWNRKTGKALAGSLHPVPVRSGDRWSGLIDQHQQAIARFEGSLPTARAAWTAYLALWNGLKLPPPHEERLFAQARRHVQASGTAPADGSGEPAAAAAPPSTLQDCEACPPLQRVPAGDYLRGGRTVAEVREAGFPVPVRLGSFWVGRTEVTQRQWMAVTGSNPSSPKAVACGLDCPVNNVSWADAQAFVRLLSARTGARYRLPSADEWEYAARAGATTPYTTGAQITQEQANVDGRAPVSFKPVGSYPANAWGLHDVHGNVAEWAQDCFVQTALDRVEPEPAPEPCTRRLVRGDGVGMKALPLHRKTWHDGKLESIGLRVVRDPD